MKNIIEYTSQSRFDFDTDELLASGFSAAYVTCFVKNNECFSEPEVILANLEKLWERALQAKAKGLEVYPLFITIGHPEGNYKMPDRYRIQRNLDGTKRSGFICFLDRTRQNEVILFAKRAAELGFSRIAFDDDLRDAFCYCDEHIYGFEPFKSKSREEISAVLNDVFTNPEHEDIRLKWYEYKKSGMEDFARRLERAVHEANSLCQIGIFNSAKRCQDFSGRSPRSWAKLFHTEQAPVFIRLCGECYDDNIMHLVQSTGWHSYFGEVYSAEIEKMLELTSVPTISYRSPGKVMFECSAVCVTTGESSIHWAWTEEFHHTGLNDFLSSFKEKLAALKTKVKDKPFSPLAVYIGHELGPYTPADISHSYNAKNDPLTIYNITGLTGLPVVVRPEIDTDQPAIMCSAYISRDMISKIDGYIESGGVCFLDAVAAKSYLTYGGRAQFEINGPESSLRYEISFDGKRDDMIADCPSGSTYIISTRSPVLCSEVYDTNNNLSGAVIAVIKSGKGSLVVMGYDIASTNMTLLRPGWRQKMLTLLSAADVKMPAYWSGQPGVQLLLCGNICVIINYNSNEVEGQIVFEDGLKQDIRIKSLGFEFINLH